MVGSVVWMVWSAWATYYAVAMGVEVEGGHCERGRFVGAFMM